MAIAIDHDAIQGSRSRLAGQITVSKWLVEQGGKVLITDRDPSEKLVESVRQLEGLPIEFHLGGHRREDFTDAD